jgi:hypothetical protein
VKPRRLCLHSAVVSLLLAFAGCATIPQESVELSSELTKMIRTAEASHLALVEEYISEKKLRADDFLERVWIPTFMTNGMKNTGILDSIANEKNTPKKGALLREFNEDAAVEIAIRRATIMNAIEEVGVSLRQAVRDHYGEMLVVNQALTANLKSVSDVHKTRDELLATVKVDAKKLIPLDAINGVLEKILAHKDEAEKLPEYIQQAKKILKGL